MNCDQARTEIVAFLKSELSPEAAEKLEEHLAKCPDCRKELDKAQKLLEWTEAAACDAVVKTVDDLVSNAIASKASDIHLEPQNDGTLLVRYRVDGVLHEAARVPSLRRQGITARVKMLAEMNVAKTTAPQDGRFQWKSGDEDLDIRVNCTPLSLGESIVMRILDRGMSLLGLQDMGLYEDHIKALDNVMKQPNGLILVTGPTGSGKTTTGYAMLRRINSPSVKILSIEDPVEYLIPGINQARVNVSEGFTFAAALRSFLRQDPDIIYCGEVRDLETVQLLIESSLTGHLCISTLHPDTAIGAIQRLTDMGVDPFLTANTLIAVSAQRLARKPCPDCRTPAKVDIDSPMVKFLGIAAE